MPSQNPRSGGVLVVESLRANDVDTAFCVPGESYLEVLDALVDVVDDLKVISCRHEGGASNMAEAYAKLTGKTGVCLVTRGPGACNASIGIHTAFQDSTPMVMLVGQVPRDHAGREAFQEVDFTQMFAPLAKAAMQVENAADIPAAMSEAFRIAQSGRPGPVVVALPEDMLVEKAAAPSAQPATPEHATPSASGLERLHHVLGDAERPILLLGGGGWTDRARADIQAFAEANNLPACCSFRRHHVIDNDSPSYVGEMGIGADPVLIERFKKADVAVVVGARLGEITSQGYTLLDHPKPRHTLIHVHAAAEELGRVFEPSVAIHASMPDFAAAAKTLAPVNSDRWRDWAKDARDAHLAWRTPPEYGGALDLGRVMSELEALLPDDAVVTVDAGNFSGWAQRFLRFGGGRFLLGPTSGAMGFSVPAAIAAKIACPDRVVVGCVGDGGFGMTGQEIATAMLYRAAPIILVFNNRMYGTIRMHQERNHPERTIATSLHNPDFAALAEVHGAHGEVVERTEEFRGAFERARDSGRAAIIELRVDPDVITTRTTLTAIRAQALSGGG